MFSGMPSFRPVNTYFAWRDISVFSAGILTKLGTNIYHVSGNCWKGFQSQRSKVKVICIQTCKCYNGRACRRCGVEAHLVGCPTLVKLSFTHELSFFLFYQFTALRSRAVGGRQMYSGGSVVQSTHPWEPFVSRAPPPKIARRKRAKSSITQPWITRFLSNFVQILNAWRPKCGKSSMSRGQRSRSQHELTY